MKLRRGRKNLKGRLLGIVIGMVGKGNLRKAFEDSVAAIEARNGRAKAADTSPSV
jgi:hypothetical protein